MADEDILISIVDYGQLPNPKEPREFPVVSLPIAVDRSHMGLFEGFREPVLMRAFVVRGHVLQVWVVFGSAEPDNDLFREANGALATLSFEPDRSGSAGDVGGAP